MFKLRLTNSELETEVDEDIYLLLKDKNLWLGDKTRTAHFYIYFKVDNKLTSLHRFISGAKKGDIVDHINQDTLVNTRSNLRNTSHSINMRNSKFRKSNTSGFRGVRNSGNTTYPYRSSVKFKGKTIHLGVFKTAEEASEAYRQWYSIHFPEVALPLG